MPQCKLCKQEAKLVRAHIIPRAFYQLPVEEEPAKIISSVEGRHPRRTRTGIYDPNILCDKCDGMLGRLDQHAAETLLIPGFPVRLTRLGAPVCYLYAEADPVLIHTFVASVLWRASVSSNVFFEPVALGPYAEKIAALLFDPVSSYGSNIETVLGEFNQSNVPLLNPHAIKMGGVRYWVLYAGRFTLYLKADKRPSVGSLAEYALRPGRPVFAIARDWKNSKERPIMAALARRHPNLFKPRS